MPLIKSKSKAAFSTNVREMMDAGHPQKQALAAAYSTQRKAKRADGGATTFSDNPFKLSAQPPDLQGSPGQSAEKHVYAGPLHSHTPGRTDKINLHVKPGSYVMPADVTSIIGEGNSLAGTQVMKSMFGGLKMPHGRAPKFQPPRHRMHRPTSGLPTAKTHWYNRGGHVQTSHKPIPVVVAGGEYIIPPEEIVHKFGELNHGHESLDEFVKAVRKKEIHRLKNAPPPKK